MYVCGITPYDTTHMGHASTYLAFDLVHRFLLDEGHEVRYAQNVTDVDDPLLERARDTGVDWRDLAEQQTDLFRRDMTALRALPPTSYVAVTDVVGRVACAVAELVDSGDAYAVETPDALHAEARDIYFDTRRAGDSGVWHLGSESRMTRDAMLPIFAERGGDPDRPGKRDALDPLLWRVAREGEPAWDAGVGRGRPGWHIECSVIARDELGSTIDVQGGGHDLVFPHHEMSAGHSAALTGVPLARVYAHAGLVAYEGEKMSKSLGNLVRVSDLVQQGVDPMAIRLAVFENHYRDHWEWLPGTLDRANERLAAWRAAAARARHGGASDPVTALRAALANDLDTPRAIAIVDEWARSEEPDARLVPAVDALLGIALTSEA